MKKINIALILISCSVAGIFLFVSPPAHKSDDVMISFLNTHIIEFNQLIKMAKDDEGVQVITDKVIYPRDVISKLRHQQYIQLFKKLNLQSGIKIDRDAGIYLLTTSEGMTSGGSDKGYAFQPKKIKHIYESLDGDLSTLVAYEPAYRKVDDDWYLFYQWED